MTYSISEIKADEEFNAELLLDPLFLVEPPNVPLEQSVINAITEWEFDALSCDTKKKAAPPPDATSPSAKKNLPDISSTTEEISLDDFMSDSPKSIPPKSAPAETPKLSSSEKDSGTRESKKPDDFKMPSMKMPFTPPVMPKPGVVSAAVKANPSTPNAAAGSGKAVAPSSGGNAGKEDGDARMEAVKSAYYAYEKYIISTYTRYATHNDMDRTELLKKVSELCTYISENKSFMLRMVPLEEGRRGDTFISHIMRSTVIAIAIGLEMRLSFSRLEELGASCLLHEIGMLSLPPQIYIANKALTASERVLLETHCVKGASIAGLLGFSESIKNGIEDHHECKNGSGYPNRKMGDRISMYGKIIAVACSYEAITAPRKYKAARSGFEAMVEMLKNKDGRYDDAVIKALLYSLSLFPIGAFVFLTNGRIAQVTDVNPNDPKNPIVQLINERDASGMPLTVQTNSAANKIVRVLSREEVYDAIKSMKR